MAINFPTTTGQATDGSFKHTEVGKQWSWDGVSWNIEISHSANTLNPSPSDVTFTYPTGVNINDAAAGGTSRQVTGTGTQADPYVLGAIIVDARTGQTNLTGSTYEEIVIQGTAGQPVEFVAINDPDNMWDQPVGTVDANGRWKGRLFFNGNRHKDLRPTENKNYIIDIKLGSSTVYWRTNVTVVTRGSATVTKYYDKPGVIDFTFSHHIFIPSLYACSTDQPFHGAFWDTNTYTYTRGADGYRWTTGVATFTNYNCGVPANNNCQESGGWHRLYRLEFFQMPFQYTPGTWFSNNDDPTHTVNVPTTNNAFTGAFDSGRATSTGGTMSWNPDYANLGGIKFRYNVALYDDNTGTESRAKIDGTWGSWVQHAANGWATIGSAATAGVESNLQHIETRAHSSAPSTLPGFYAVRFDSTASSKYGNDGAIIENKDETTPLYMNGYLPYEDEGSFYPVTEWGTWSGTKCANGGWWGEAFYTCQSEVNWDTVDSVVYTEIQSFTTSIGTITPYPFGYDVIDGVKTIYASSNPTNFNFSNDGYAQPSYFTYVWSSTSTGVTFDDATKREPEVTFDANDPGLKTLTVTITSTESGITDSGASGSVEVNVLASYSNETIGTVTVSTIPISMGEDIEGSTQVKDKYMFSASYDGSTAIPKYTWTVTDTLSPVAPVIESPNAIETYITFQYDPLIVTQSGDRTVTCTITATDATDSPASDDELIYIGMS